MSQREFDAAVRLFADANTARLDEIPSNARVMATITLVTPGASKDANALVTVEWRGREFVANGYNRAYTPVVGHRVMCDLVNSTFWIDYSPVGFP